MVKLTDSAYKALDRMEKRERKLKKKKRLMPMHGRGLLTVTEKLREKDADARLKRDRNDKTVSQNNLTERVEI